jgi:hypothetical protein
MILKTTLIFRRAIEATLLIAASAILTAASASSQNIPVKNIVLVHGAWADGSGWKGVDRRTKEGTSMRCAEYEDTLELRSGTSADY